MEYCQKGELVGRPMPYHFEFDARNKVLRARFRGTLTNELLSEFYNQIEAFVRYTKPTSGITDFSEVTYFDASAGTVRHLAQGPPAAKSPIKHRVIVAVTPHQYAMSRMFHILGEETRPGLKVVRSLEEAYAVLDVKDPLFKKIVLPQTPDSDVIERAS